MLSSGSAAIGVSALASTAYGNERTEVDQHEYSALFSPLLRLLVTHFPHLSLVDDWIDEETIAFSDSSTGRSISEHSIVEAFEEIELNPARVIKLLRRMMRKSPTDLWPLAPTFILRACVFIAHVYSHKFYLVLFQSFECYVFYHLYQL